MRVELQHNSNHEFFHQVLALAIETTEQMGLHRSLSEGQLTGAQFALSIMMLEAEQYPLFYNGMLECLREKGIDEPAQVTLHLLRCVWEHTPRLCCAMLHPHLDQDGAAQFLAELTKDSVPSDELVRCVQFVDA